MSRWKAIQRVLVLVFCIAVMLTGMYTPNMGVGSCFSCSDIIHALSVISGYDKRMDAVEEKIEAVTDEVKENSSSVTKDTFAYKINLYKSLFSAAFLPAVLLIAWAILTVLFLKKFIDRMYLIMFIHNSDGEKGRASILMA